MPIFDRFQRASFAGIAFPVSEITIDGAIRDHAHEYPHAPGGAPEKLGRKLYVFQMRAMFHSTFRDYPGLYPLGWNRLRNKFEAELTDDLVVPTLGTLKAYAMTWRETANARARSGVAVELSFREDLQDAFTANALVVSSDTGLDQSRQRLALQAQIFAQTPPGQLMLDGLPDTELPPDPTKATELSLLASIDAAASAVFAIRDQIELANTVAETQVLRLLSLCQALAARPALLDMRNHPLRDALYDVWSAGDERRRDIARRRQHVLVYVTPLPRMSVIDVSRAVYGDANHAIQILQLNKLADPFLIQRGTQLRVYRPAQPQAAA